MSYRLIRQVRNCRVLRESFMDLARRTFGLCFADWYRQGFWSEDYIPYVFEDHGRVIANVSVNRIRILDSGDSRLYIQLGTVMTDPAYRLRGLAAALIREIQKDWRDCCSGIYLYANDTVLDFYPRFGFQKAAETQCSLPIEIHGGDYQPLNMDRDADRLLFRRCWQKSNPYARLTMPDNWGLVMFYCNGPLKNCVYYSPERDALCIAVREGGSLICYDLFCDPGPSMEEQLSALPFPGERQVLLGFTPAKRQGIRQFVRSGEDQLFVWQEKENPFAHGGVMFPLLSHA